MRQILIGMLLASLPILFSCTKKCNTSGGEVKTGNFPNEKCVTVENAKVPSSLPTSPSTPVATTEPTSVPTSTPAQIPTYSVSVNISGLVGTITLQNNGGDDLSLLLNGSFSFSHELVSGANYAVSILTQPSGQLCSVISGAGAIANSAVLLAVSCKNIWPSTIQIGVSGNNQTIGFGTSVDYSGNVYVTGYTSGPLEGQTQHGNTDMFITKYNSSGTRQWTIQKGDTGGTTNGNGIALDSSGNVYVTGVTSVALDSSTQHAGLDFFLTKYNSSGVQLWTVQNAFGGGNTYGNGVATDSSDNVYVTGYEAAPAKFFIEKFNSSGAPQWNVQDKGMGKGITTDGSSVYVTGNTSAALVGQTQNGPQDLFIAKYNSSGLRQWAVQDGVSGGFVTGYGITTDALGDVYIAGSTSGPIDGQTRHGGYDLLITKYNSSGTRQWTVQDGASPGTTAATGNAITSDTQGNIYVAGMTNVALDGQTQHGINDLLITKYNSSGTRQWTVQDGASGGQPDGYGMAADTLGNIYVTGTTNVALDGQTQHGVYDLIITQYSSAGIH